MQSMDMSLAYIDKQGIKVESENEKFEFRYGGI
jgi:hypothetical protein